MLCHYYLQSPSIQSLTKSRRSEQSHMRKRGLRSILSTAYVAFNLASHSLIS
ncbi:unnamed protein product, partial [Cylicocyclus nassatus]